MLLAAIMIAIAGGTVAAQALPLETAANITIGGKAAYTVSRGSYYLSRNITISGGTASAIRITGPNVTIDFRGYSIIGKNSAQGIGIDGTGQPNLTIQNGNVLNMGGGGVAIGNGSTVRSMHITGNGPGIACGVSCLVEDNSVSSNNGDGIAAAGVIRDNSVDNNTGNGITAGADSSITGNEVSGNGATGIAMASGAGFSNNVVNGTTPTSGGANAGNNICNGAACP